MEYVPIAIPMVTGYLTSYYCPNTGSQSGASVKFRPPPAAFGIIWPILYLFLGYAWYLERKQYQPLQSDLFYISLIFCLNAWIYVYTCQNKKKEAVWVLGLCIMFAILCFASSNQRSKLLLSPLITWLIIALLMNATEVQNM